MEQTGYQILTLKFFPKVINANISKTMRVFEKIHNEQIETNWVSKSGFENSPTAKNIDAKCA